MSILSLLGFILFVLLVMMIVAYLLWTNKRQKLEKESYEMHQLMQDHYRQLNDILVGLEPIMTDDMEFFEELKSYVKQHCYDYPVLGDIDGLEAEEFYEFLTHLQADVKKHISAVSSPITQQLDHMSLSLTRAREAFTYANNAYKMISSSFPISLMARMLEDEKFPKERGTV